MAPGTYLQTEACRDGHVPQSNRRLTHRLSKATTNPSVST